MPGWHKPAPPSSEPHNRGRARIGLILFWIYLAFYAVYVIVNAFWPHFMDATLGGVNLAILYGFALIGAALVMALLYGWICRGQKD